MSASVDVRQLLEAIVSQARQSSVNAHRKAEKSAARLGQRHELADQVADVKAYWLEQKEAVREVVLNLIEAAEDVEKRAGLDREPRLRGALARMGSAP